MARAGAKPKPTSLKLVQGTLTAADKRARENEVAIEAAIPEPPVLLKGKALEEWRRIVTVLFDVGLMSEADRTGLSAYCLAYGRWMDAEEELQKQDMIIYTDKGNAIQNPLVGIANVSMRDCMRYAVEFGMTPSARSRVQVEKVKDKDGKTVKQTAKKTYF